MPPGVLPISIRPAHKHAAYAVTGDPFADDPSPRFPIPGHVHTAFPSLPGWLPSPG